MNRNPNDRDYTNGEITVHWRPAECIHDTTCFVKLRSVFNPGRRPWVDMFGATTEQIIDIVDQCPTNALTYSWNKDVDSDQKRLNQNENKLSIKVLRNGPLVCKGDFILSDQEGKVFSTQSSVTLCRCAYSRRQPYCDGRHKMMGFSDQ